MILRNYFPNLLLVLLLLHPSKCTKLPSKKLNRTLLITGGTPVDSHNLRRYLVSIQLPFPNGTGWFHFCGGTIVAPTHILTAAHCVLESDGSTRPISQMIVVVGLRRQSQRNAPGVAVMEVKQITAFPDYDRKKCRSGDIAVVTLKNKIKFNRYAAIVKISNRITYANVNCTVTGWGRIFENGPPSDEPLFIDVLTMSWKYCKWFYGVIFTRGMMCAADPQDWSKSGCHGDSGGPLICNNLVVGIVSWGVGCGVENYPPVYTDVNYYKKFLARFHISVAAKFYTNLYLAMIIIFLILN